MRWKLWKLLENRKFSENSENPIGSSDKSREILKSENLVLTFSERFPIGTFDSDRSTAAELQFRSDEKLVAGQLNNQIAIAASFGYSC